MWYPKPARDQILGDFRMFLRSIGGQQKSHDHTVESNWQDFEGDLLLAQPPWRTKDKRLLKVS